MRRVFAFAGYHYGVKPRPVLMVGEQAAVVVGDEVFAGLLHPEFEEWQRLFDIGTARFRPAAVFDSRTIKYRCRSLTSVLTTDSSSDVRTPAYIIMSTVIAHLSPSFLLCLSVEC